MALSEAIEEVTFVIQLLGSMKNFVMLLLVVRVDNVGTIFMASNITTTPCTKHTDIRYKYVNEYVQARVMKNIFVKSAENGSNILTKIKC